MNVIAIQPPSCYRCQSREWNDGISVSETIVLILKPDLKIERIGRKYNEDREQVWQCSNGHLARAQTAAKLERLLTHAEEREGT